MDRRGLTRLPNETAHAKTPGRIFIEEMALIRTIVGDPGSGRKPLGLKELLQPFGYHGAAHRVTDEALRHQNVQIGDQGIQCKHVAIPIMSISWVD